VQNGEPLESAECGMQNVEQSECGKWRLWRGDYSLVLKSKASFEIQVSLSAMMAWGGRMDDCV